MSLGNPPPRVLVVTHDLVTAELLFTVLSQQGYEIVVAIGPDEALRNLATRSYDCVLICGSDDATVRPVLDELRRYPPETVAFVLVGSGSDVSAVDALRQGAFDYVASPGETDELKATVARAIERASLARTMRELVEDFDSANARLRAFASDLQSRLDNATAQLQRKLAELDEANRKLAEEKHKREEFIAMVVHDLAAPLTTIDGYVQVLGRPNLPAGLEQRARSAVGSETRRMARLLHDLSVALPSTNGGFDVQPGTCDLSDIVHQQVELARLRTDRHEISLEAPRRRVLVVGDADRLAQVIGNLLVNAITHTACGRITVTLWHTQREAGVRVSDEGPGIPRDLLESIFEQHVRGAPDATSADGSGLGLYIARSIVQALGGRIWAESEGQAGATFHVALPVPG